MRGVTRKLLGGRGLVLASLAVGVMALLPAGIPAQAASKPSKKQAPAAEQQPADDAGRKQSAKQAYDAALKAFTAGRYQNAVEGLNVALRGGGLSGPEMAKGLYFRGVSYKRLNKPGLAISDLTSALWLKNGLSDQERASATAERDEAYKAAGLTPGTEVAAAVPTPAPAAPKTAPAGAAAAATAAAAAPVTNTPPAAATRPTPSEAASEGVPQPLSLGNERSTGPAPRPTQTAAADDGIAGGAGASSDGGGGFFSNIFGDSPKAAVPAGGAAPAPQAVAAPVPAPIPAPVAAPKQAEASAPKAGAGQGKPVQTAAITPAPAKASGGKYKIHIAALRSRGEADALAKRLMAEHGAQFANRAPSVDEAVIGSMGTFYRVRIGSYATPEEPRGLCNTLRSSGYDCLVVSN